MRMRTTVAAVAVAMMCASLLADIPESVDVLVLGGTVRGVSAASHNSYPTGPSPCPCPGVDTSFSGNCRPHCSAA